MRSAISSVCGRAGRPTAFPPWSRGGPGDVSALPSLTRILLIDGSGESRRAIRAALSGSNLNYDLVEADTAEKGLAEAAARNFDCVLLDCRPGGLGGADYLARLISPEGGQQAVIALTDQADDAGAVAWLQAGATDSLNRAETDAPTLARAIRYARSRHAITADLRAARWDA